MTAGRSVTLRRACDPAEIGEAAAVLEAVLGAALHSLRDLDDIEYLGVCRFFIAKHIQTGNDTASSGHHGADDETG